MDAAKKTERKFLNISDTWTPAEKRVFKKGVALYRGALRTCVCICCCLYPPTYVFLVLGLARVEYCKCANLTSALLDEKSVPELKQIAANLAVEVESSAHADTVSLRDRLKMFILYGWCSVVGIHAQVLNLTLLYTIHEHVKQWHFEYLRWCRFE